MDTTTEQLVQSSSRLHKAIADLTAEAKRLKAEVDVAHAFLDAEGVSRMHFEDGVETDTPASLAERFSLYHAIQEDR